MQIKANEISSIIEKKLAKYEDKLELEEYGLALKISDGIVEVYGLNNAFYGELVIFENNITGMVQNLEEHSVGVILFGDDSTIISGMRVKRTEKIISIPVGDGLLGRVVNAIGDPIDGKGELKTKKTRPVERVAPGIMTRKSVSETLETGILAIDSIIPIGKGQRELIIGDRKTGKTQIALDTIINQKGKDVICVYVAIGQKQSTVSRIVKALEKTGAMEYTTVVLASASEYSPLQYIAPYSGVAIAEEWMEEGKDVLIVYDDLTKHAAAYRTLSLLLKRPPGREAFPGDVFYLHSRLLERAARLNEENGGGSITALPIIETLAGDISAYIPTNVISITDGQLFLMESLFNSGQRPAIDPGLSVSRVGGAAQHQIIKTLSGSIKLELSQYRELEAFSKFGSDLDDSTKSILHHGKRLLELLKQPINSPRNIVQETAILFAAKYNYIDDIELKNIKDYELRLCDIIENNTKLAKMITEEKKFNKDIENELVKVVEKFTKDFNKKYA